MIEWVNKWETEEQYREEFWTIIDSTLNAGDNNITLL